MAKNGQIVSAWSDANQAYIALVTQELQTVDGKQVTQAVEHVVALPLRDRVDANGQKLEDIADMDDATKLDVLTKAVIDKRDSQFEVSTAVLDVVTKSIDLDAKRAELADAAVIKE